MYQLATNIQRIRDVYLNTNVWIWLNEHALEAIFKSSLFRFVHKCLRWFWIWKSRAPEPKISASQDKYTIPLGLNNELGLKCAQLKLKRQSPMCYNEDLFVTKSSRMSNRDLNNNLHSKNVSCMSKNDNYTNNIIINKGWGAWPLKGEAYSGLNVHLQVPRLDSHSITNKLLWPNFYHFRSI